LEDQDGVGMKRGKKTGANQGCNAKSRNKTEEKRDTF